MRGRGAYNRRTVPPQPTSLGERIRAWRLGFGYSQKSLAVAVGVGQSTVAMWERDEHLPAGPAMKQLVRVLGVSEHALVTGDGFKVPSLPPTGHGEAVDPEAGGDLMAIEKDTKVPLVLPSAHPGEIWGLEIGSEAQEPLSPEDALEWLQAAIDEDKVVWIVTRPSGGLKAARRLLKRNPKR